MTRLAFLLDVDNTLLANDEVKKNLDQRLHAVIGEQLAGRFWEIYEQVRKEKSVVDIPLSLQRLRAETPVAKMDDATYQRAHAVFDTYPFFEYLYPHVIETLHHLRKLGLTIIVSDGDQYFQEEKIVNSHLAAAVEGRVLIYIHKQQHLEEILQRYPAEHYVMVETIPSEYTLDPSSSFNHASRATASADAGVVQNACANFFSFLHTSIPVLINSSAIVSSESTATSAQHTVSGKSAFV